MQVLENKQATIAQRNRHSKVSVLAKRRPVGVPSLPRQTFLVCCPVPTLRSGIAETFHALYYLPENFMLILPRTAIANEEIPMIIAASPLANRVQFYDKEGSSIGGPSCMADAVICSDSQVVRAEIPVIVVSSVHGGLRANKHGYTVGASPEAIASALLSVARAQGMAE